jgi:hypothetical protein
VRAGAAEHHHVGGEGLREAGYRVLDDVEAGEALGGETQAIEEALLLVQLGGALIADLEKEDAGLAGVAALIVADGHGRECGVGHCGRIVADVPAGVGGSDGVPRASRELSSFGMRADTPRMVPYLNLDGNSGVVAYEIGTDFVRAQFHGKRPYLYTYDSVGRHNVERMKELAKAGRGLATFISQHREVHDGFVSE